MKQIILFGKKHFFTAQFLRFLVAGFINTGLDFTLFIILTSVFNINVTVANLCSSGVTLIFSYFINRLFVFKAVDATTSHFIHFAVWTLFSVWVVQTSIVTGLHFILGRFIGQTIVVNSLSKIGGVSVSMLLNFLRYKFIFGNKTTAKSVV